MQTIEILNPIQKYIPVVASIPHSGMYIPQNIAKICNKHHLQTLRNTDWYLDKLYNFLPEMGIHVIKANFSRYVIDPNRPLQEPLFGKYQKCAVYKTNTWGEEIYDVVPSDSQIRQRITDYYHPYHKALHEIITKLQTQFERIILLDLHSFMGPIDNEICLGDFFGKSCSQKLINSVYQSFTANGYDTVINKVYSGGHIVKYYSRMPDIETLQIEIRYTNYLKNEGLDDGIIPRPEGVKFEEARTKLQKVFSEIISGI